MAGSTRAFLVVFASLCAATGAGAGARGEERAEGNDWPRWRGADGTGVSTETAWVPEKLRKLAFAWRAEVGTGFSGVAVVGDRLYTMGNTRGTDGVSCLDARTGAVVWTRTYPCPLGEYPGPRVTPAVDGDRLYTLSQEGDLLCLDRESGSVVWQRHLVRDFGASKPSWGFAGSPVVWEDLVLLNGGRAGMAVDKATGALLWGERGTGGYASAVLLEVQGRTHAAVFGQNALLCVDARTGREAWSYPWVTTYDVNAADPLVAGNTIFISSNYGRGCALLAFTASTVEPVWENGSVSSHFSSFLFADGAIFANDGDANSHRGTFLCLDPGTGATRWAERLGVGSLLGAGDKLFLLDERGTLRVAEARSSAYREIASASFPAALYWTAPVLSRGRLYVRNLKGELYCVDLRP